MIQPNETCTSYETTKRRNAAGRTIGGHHGSRRGRPKQWRSYSTKRGPLSAAKADPGVTAASARRGMHMALANLYS